MTPESHAPLRPLAQLRGRDCWGRPVTLWGRVTGGGAGRVPEGLDAYTSETLPAPDLPVKGLVKLEHMFGYRV